VREEAYYFHPIFACQIMNEGWASYWHARLLREASFLPHELYLAAIKSHSDVVRPFGSGQQLALSVNPYHLGFSMWEHIIDKHGWTRRVKFAARKTTSVSSATTWTGNWPTKLDLFVYETRKDGDTASPTATSTPSAKPYWRPSTTMARRRIAVTQVGADGSLDLQHDYLRDGRGLDLQQAERVMEYVEKVWRRPVTLHTVDFRGVVRVLPVRKAPPI
jgi:stage V sporulation protein R